MATTEIAERTDRTPTAAQRTKQILETRKGEFAAALAGRVDPEAFIRVAYTTITKSPKLLEATPASLMMALLEAATLGLMPNGVMGEAYIVPFNNKVKENGKERWEVQAQFIPGYRGLVKLARQSGVIKTIVARVVREGDAFSAEYGLDEKLVHIPQMDGDEDREMLRVYAVAYFTDGTRQFEVMSRQQVDKIRARSKSKDSGPWVSDYEAMALKTVIRRLVKYLPLSDFDLARAVEADNRLDVDDVTTILQAEAARPLSRTAELRSRLAPAQTATTEIPIEGEVLTEEEEYELAMTEVKAEA